MGLLHLGSSEPQAGCDYLSLEYQLPALLPVLLVAVISEAPHYHNLKASLQALVDVVSQRAEGHNPVEDRRQVVVLVAHG